LFSVAIGCHQAPPFLRAKSGVRSFFAVRQGTLIKGFGEGNQYNGIACEALAALPQAAGRSLVFHQEE